MVQTNKSRGRPAKPADLRYPQRKATRELIAQMRTEGSDNAPGLGRVDTDDEGEFGTLEGSGEGYDTRPIILSETTSAPETQTPPYPEFEDEADGDAEVVRNFRCSECGYVLVYGEPVCPGCGDRKNWSKVGE